MSKKSFLLGDVELPLDEIKKLSQYFEDVLTYDDNKNLVPKKGADGNNLKKLRLNFSIFEDGFYGKNVTFVIPQSKEQIENGEKKTYVANGKIYYASDDLQNFVQRSSNKNESNNNDSVEEDDLIF